MVLVRDRPLVSLNAALVAVIASVLALKAVGRRRLAKTSLLASAVAGLLYCRRTWWRANRLWVGTDPRLKKVTAELPKLHRCPRPPLWAYNPHLQLLPFMLVNMAHERLCPLKFDRRLVTVNDRLSKSTPADAEANPRCMPGSVALDFFPAVTALPVERPCIVVLPGLACNSQDIPGSGFLRLAAARGMRCCVVGRRGHQGKLLSARFNVFGDEDDLEDAVKHISATLPGAPLFLYGVSSGSKLTVGCLGRWDHRRTNGDDSVPEFVAAAAVCPGYDIRSVLQSFPFPYNSICAAAVKALFIEPNAEVLRDANPSAFHAAMEAQDLQTFLLATVPFTGFVDVDAYMADQNPVQYTHQITTPSLVINAEDDPMCAVGNAFESSPFHDDGPTYAELFAKSPCGVLAITPTGSHCPFLDGRLAPFVRLPMCLGGIALNSWAESCTLDFFESVLRVYHDRSTV